MPSNKNKKLLVLLTGFFLYLVIGAVVFKAVEQGKDSSSVRLKQVYENLKAEKNLTMEKFNAMVNEIHAILQSGSKGSEWTFYSSLYFCGSVVTTIGYGHMTPKTPVGRVIVMFYAIIGIPLNLWTLKVMGDTITSLLSKIISKVEKSIFRKADLKNVKLKVVAAMAVLNIAMLLLGGALYWWSEKWTYLEGVYYCFIVYSTIGFGDLVPSEGHAVGTTNNDIVMMFVRAFNLIIGLSLLSSLLSSIILAADELKVAFPAVNLHRFLKRNRIVAIGKDTTVNGEDLKAFEQRPERALKVDEISEEIKERKK